jgi:hypothetical protein
VNEVRLSMMIQSYDGSAEVGRRLTLPFAPFAGLLLDFEDDGDCAHVATVEWSVPAGYFRVQCQPYDERALPLQEQMGVRQWLEYYLSRGWFLALAPEVIRGAEAGARRAPRSDE